MTESLVYMVVILLIYWVRRCYPLDFPCLYIYCNKAT
ncbi:hypothetical protein IX330_002281 [Bacteroides pyogenes]|nr:hypothetical protein [Bacteroides pyogenes]MBR8794037.1 hypothetical protein [Bacteroides pyogenes]